MLLLLSINQSCGHERTAPVVQSQEEPSGAIFLDGHFDDWRQIQPIVSDEVGDVEFGEVDFGDLRVSNDEARLYIAMDLGRETILRAKSFRIAGNDIRIHFTHGISVFRGPAEVQSVQTSKNPFERLEILFGGGRVSLSVGGKTLPMSLNQIGLISAPTYSSSKYEISIPVTIPIEMDGPLTLKMDSEVAFFLEDVSGGDRVPNQDVILYRFERKTRPSLVQIPIVRGQDSGVRLLSHNVCFTGMAERPGPFIRYLKLLQPDIVGFQEVWEWSSEQVKGFLQDAMPGDWYVSKHGELVTLSRFPILEDVGLRSALIVKIDLPDQEASQDLVLYNVHSPCCGDNAGRDRVHDMIASTWRELLSGDGEFTVNRRDTVVMLGDFNLEGFQHQLRSIRDGDIFDNTRFGADFAPARSNGSLTSAPLRHTHSRHFYTWRADPSPITPAKLDYIFFSGDTATLKNSFALWTPDIPDDELQTLGLEKGDSMRASDHLVLVADLVFE